MPLVTELELPFFDPADASLTGGRFHAAMAELRVQGWLAAGPYGPIVLEREAGELFLRTRAAVFPGMKIAEIFGVEEGPLFEQMKRNILHVNGPDHARLRSLVNPALAPRAVERYRPVMRETLRELMADVLARAQPADDGEVRCELVEDFAKPYPSQVIASVMGAPMADAPRLHHWSNWIQKQFDALAMANERAGIERAVEEFYEYAQELIGARRSEPADDLISMLIAAAAPDSDPPDRLSDVECINLVFNILAGGVDTTQSQLAHAVRLLAERPEQWRRLAAEPSLAQSAVEEALRYEPITPFTARLLLEDVEHRGVTFPRDTIVLVCAFTANRDLGEDDGDADAFEIAAERGRARALTFGAGVHYCLGASLARLELQEGLAFLAERMPGLRLDGEPQYGTVTGIYGLERLPIAFDARAAAS